VFLSCFRAIWTDGWLSGKSLRDVDQFGLSNLPILMQDDDNTR
jgi:hypothetical protein